MKRLSGGVTQQQNGISSAFCGSENSNVKLGSLGRFDIQALAASGQIPPQTLAALHAELLGRAAGNLCPAVDQPALLHASLLGSKHIPVEHGLAFGQSPIKCQAGPFKQYPQSLLSVEDASRFGAWMPNSIGTVGPNNNIGELNNQNGNLLMEILQQQQQQKQLQQQQSMMPEPGRSPNVQPSRLVVPSQSSANFQAGSPASVNQNCSFNRSSVIDYSILSPQSNVSSLNGISNGDHKTHGVHCGYSAPGSRSTLTSCSLNGDNNTSHRNPTVLVSDVRQLTGILPSLADIPGSYVGMSCEEILDQGHLQNLGFVGKGTFIPSRFAVDEYESPLSNLNNRKFHSENSANPVKQEPNMDFTDNATLVLRQFPSNDLMSVFTK